MFRAPTQLPNWSTLMRDIPASPAQIARHLGISTRTLERYTAAEQAPRAVSLALFWESRWGISTADVTAANTAARYYQLAQSLQRENERLRAQLQKLQETSDFGAANAPLWRA